MANKIVALVVTLHQLCEEDQAQRVAGLLKMISGVADVRPVPDDFDKSIARSLAACEIRKQIMDILYPE
jgi:hypothetical protein